MRAALLGLRLAFGSFRRNLLRSGLTMLGIVVAVAALTVVSAIGVAARARVATLFRVFKSIDVIVYPDAGLRGSSRLSESDAVAILRDVALVRNVAPTIIEDIVVFHDEKRAEPLVFGVTNAYFEVRSFGVTEGEMWTSEDEATSARVCIIGETLREQLFGTGDAIGETIRIRRQPYRIVGVHDHLGFNPKGDDLDADVLVPLSTMRTRLAQLPRGAVTTVYVSARAREMAPAVEQEVTELLRARHNLRAGEALDFRTARVTTYAAGEAKADDTLSKLLSWVASISLLVGGLGITNVMLVNVAERKREIGISLAIGGGPTDIALQFLVEAVVLSGLGGIVGLVVGVVASSVLAATFGWNAFFDPMALVVAVAGSTFTGFVFGFVPAVRAGRLDPVVAMRRD